MTFNSEEFDRVKVLVVDDHTLFAEGTVSLLSVEPRFSVVGIAKNGIECLDLIGQAAPDVVLLDINLPDTCGTDLIEEIEKVRPEVKILMLTGQNPKGYVTKSLSKGAHGFLLKDCSGKELTQAILRVHEGGVYFSHDLETYLHPLNSGDNLHFPVKSEKTLCKLLSNKEIEIIELVSRGLHNKEIASDLGINVRAVDGHVSDILHKLGVGTRMEAILKWAYVDQEK